MSQQLYARIKRTSKYYGQGKRGQLFAVEIGLDPYGYVVKGGPGGQYRMIDVAIYVVVDGQQIRIE